MAGRRRTVQTASRVERPIHRSAPARVGRPVATAALAGSRSLLLDTSMRSCRGMLQFIADVQRAQSRMAQDLGMAMVHSMQESHLLADMHRLMLLQAQLSSASVLGALRMGTGLIAHGVRAEGCNTSPQGRADTPADDAAGPTREDVAAALSPARSQMLH